MGDQKVKRKLLLFMLLLSACSAILYRVKLSMREPGEKLLLHPKEAYRRYHCEEEERPFLSVVLYEVVPPEVAPGEEVNQHLEYIFCPRRPAEVVPGTLLRRIYYRGEVTFEDADQDFELKPGKWALDAFIRVPPSAPEGVYHLEARFRSHDGKLSFREGQDFVVREKR